MSTKRLETLTAILERDPTNLLARYGLAMEYAQQGDQDRAVEIFRTIMASNPDYVATYYQAGQVLQRMGLLAQARETYEQGIAACNRVGNLHAKGELEAALEQL